MFEVSHRLIGIYKVANATKSKQPILRSVYTLQYQRFVS